MDDLFSVKPMEIAPKVLFVCTGNICRSAYAQQKLRALLASSPNRFGLTVESAGTFAVVGAGIDGTTLQVVQQNGLATEHRARQLTDEVASTAGLVLVMTMEHRNDVLTSFPSLTRQTYTLAEFAALAPHGANASSFSDSVSAISNVRYTFTHSAADDVDDPYRKPLDHHQRAAAQIDALLQQSMVALT